MKTKKEILFDYIAQQAAEESNREPHKFTTQELSERLSMQRSNLSTLLNDLVEEGKLEKLPGRPVLYCLRQTDPASKKEESCFQNLIGADGSMKHMVQLAKAAILYPEHSMNTLIAGPAGSGKSHLAELMASFARSNGVIRENAPFIRFNCSYYEGEDDQMYRGLFGNDRLEDSAIFRAQGGILCIHHAELLSVQARDELFDMIERNRKELQNMILIATIDDSCKRSVLDSYTTQFSVRIELPALIDRPLEDRFYLVQEQFKKEAARIRKDIRVDAELLHSLLLYRCEGNIKQLQNDMKLGCANAYSRNFNREANQMYVHLNDFPPMVRKGLLYYKNRHEEVEKLISHAYTYVFTANGMEREERLEGQTPAKTEGLYAHESMYQRIDRKTEMLRARGIGREEINAIVNADLEYDMRDMMYQLNNDSLSRMNLEKTVDKKIINLVENFLREASTHFDRVYTEAVFYGLCLHIQATLEHPGRSQYLPNERIMETAEKHREEYAFCMKFAAEIEKEFQVRLSMDEVVFITLFLTEAAVTKSDRHKPTILIAMHGDSTASSMAKVVNDLAKCDNVYAFDMPLSMDMHEAYEELEKKIRQVDDGEGILIIYDMGSIKTMTDMISKETGIEIRTLEMPATLLAMEGSRKATSLDTLDELYDSVLERYQSSYISLAESYRRHVNPKIIITLCMSGHGGAVQMKNYLEKYLTLDDVDIVPIATNDKKFLLDEVNRIRQDHEILYVIGTYDPTLHGIPFIPVTQLFETPVDKLDILLSLKNVKFSTTMDYDIIYQSMAEEMPELNINLLKRHLPRVMEKIRKIIRGFTEDQEVGLFMHIASAIYHQILHEEVPENTNRDAILSRNKRLYNDLRDILKPLENAFDIQFSNDELSYMISIIKQI